LTELHIRDFTGHVKEQWPDLARITTKEQGREILLDLVDRNIERVEEILAVHVQKAEKQDKKAVVKLSADQTQEGRRLLEHKKRCENAYLRGNSACKNYKKGWGREDGGRRLEDGGRRTEDGGWRRSDGPAAPEKVDLSWAYGAYPWREGAGGGAEAGGEISAGASERPPTAACGGDSPTPGVGALEVDREPTAACGGDSPARAEAAFDLDRLAAAAGKIGSSPTKGNGASENEANLHETVITAERVENAHVTVNSGVDLGLDNTERSQFPESTVGLDDDGEGAPHPGPLPVSGAREEIGVAETVGCLDANSDGEKSEKSRTGKPKSQAASPRMLTKREKKERRWEIRELEWAKHHSGISPRAKRREFMESMTLELKECLRDDDS
jgi:hypothetical protein